METINVNKQIKKEFEKERFYLNQKEDELISQADFIKKLIINWRMKK